MKKDEDFILKIIKQIRIFGLNILELCDKKMLQILCELLEMNNFEVKCLGLYKYVCRVILFNYIYYVILLVGQGLYILCKEVYNNVIEKII